MLAKLHSIAKKKTSAGSQIDPARLPRHVAVIMDGNGRWARARGLPRTMGHRKGVETTRRFVELCGELGIQEVTLYAFSAENWGRPQEEVQELMNLLRHYLEKERAYFMSQKVRLRIVGDRTPLDADLRDTICAMEKETAQNDRLRVNVALSYGGRQELVQAMRTLGGRVKAGQLLPEAITEADVASALYAPDMPEPDLLVRTGGDQRISNFLLWQMAYTEFYFTDTLWPDFDEAALQKAILTYQGRQRRFGLTGEQVKHV